MHCKTHLAPMLQIADCRGWKFDSIDQAIVKIVQFLIISIYDKVLDFSNYQDLIGLRIIDSIVANNYHKKPTLISTTVKYLHIPVTMFALQRCKYVNLDFNTPNIETLHLEMPNDIFSQDNYTVCQKSLGKLLRDFISAIPSIHFITVNQKNLMVVNENGRKCVRVRAP